MAVDPNVIAQVNAAWVSAWASVIQAVGAIAAIGVSIHLTRKSDERARIAEENAAQYMRDADERAEARIKQARNEDYNRPLLKLIGRIEVAIQEANHHLDGERSRQNIAGVFEGGIDSQTMREIVGEYSELVKIAPCAKSAAAISRLQKFPPKFVDHQLRSHADHLGNIVNQIAELSSIRDELTASLRN